MTATPSKTSTPLDLSDIAKSADFIRECEKEKIATRGQLQWWFRYRDENGLTASGAVVERRVNPRSKRPMLFVVRPRFVAWLAGEWLAGEGVGAAMQADQIAANRNAA